MLIQLLNGLVYGGLMYLLAVGLVLLFGLRGTVNFAHGSLFMLGAYIAFTTAQHTNFWVALLVSTFSLAIVGAILDRFVLQPLQKEGEMITVLVTYGVLLIIEDLVKAIWGPKMLTLEPPAELSGSVNIFGDTFPIYRIAVIGVAFCVAIGLTAWLGSTRIGLYVRASSVDPVTTGTQGVNIDRVSSIVVAIGTGLAGLSGTIAAPLMALSPSMGWSVLIDSFIVVVVGGLGSFSGALIAALLIGQVHNLGIVHLPWASSLVPFLIMVCVLVWRPTGFAGNRV